MADENVAENDPIGYENVAENDPIGYGSHFLLQQPDLTHVAWLDPKIHHTFKGMKLTSFP